MVRIATGCRLVLAATALYGCASCASLRGTWYYQSEAGCQDETLYLTVVNDLGSDLNVNRVTVNGGGPGWECTSKNGMPMPPGQIIVVPLSITQAHCLVPVSAALETDGKRTLRIDLPSTMPSALPGVWRDCPAPPPEREGASAANLAVTGVANSVAPQAANHGGSGAAPGGEQECKIGRKDLWNCSLVKRPAVTDAKSALPRNSSNTETDAIENRR